MNVHPDNKEMKIAPFGILMLTVFMAFSVKSQLRLSDQAEIAVVTLGPYQGEVWSAFGHSGIRVVDPENNIDCFFDYGGYDFEQENFFLNFAQGLLKYKVVVRPYSRTFQYYSDLNRYVKEQYLNLTLEEKQLLFGYLANNVKPENAEYLYNYVYDNCATKIRDIMEELFPDRITFSLDYKEEDKTIRELMDDYLDYQPWGDFGIDLGLGMQVDKEASAYEYMFLPDYIFAAFKEATIEREGEQKRLVGKTVDAYVPKHADFRNGILTPLNIFILVFFLIGFVTNKNLKTGKRTKWLDTLLFSLVGFIGCWVTFLWLGTAHLSKWNLNILWAIPFHLPLVLFVNRERFRFFFKNYFRMIGYGYCLLLITWAWLPQPLGMALVPLVLAMILRAFYISYDMRRKTLPVPQKVVEEV